MPPGNPLLSVAPVLNGNTEPELAVNPFGLPFVGASGLPAPVFDFLADKVVAGLRPVRDAFSGVHGECGVYVIVQIIQVELPIDVLIFLE